MNLGDKESGIAGPAITIKMIKIYNQQFKKVFSQNYFMAIGIVSPPLSTAGNLKLFELCLLSRGAFDEKIHPSPVSDCYHGL